MSAFSLTSNQIDTIKGDNASASIKAAIAIVSGTAKAYSKLSVRLHVTAAIAAFMASKHGNTDALNKMFAFLKKNDQTALRNWLLEHSSFSVKDSEGNKHKLNWIMFKDEAFGVKKNTKSIKFSEHRAHWTLEQWFSLASFQTRDNVAEAEQKAYSLMEVVKKEVKKADAIAVGDNDKFFYEESDNNRMLNSILHAITVDERVLSSLYAKLKGNTPEKEKAEGAKAIELAETLSAAQSS